MYLYTALLGLLVGATTVQSTVDLSQYVLTSVSFYNTKYQNLPNIISRMERLGVETHSLGSRYLLVWSGLDLMCSRELIVILEIV